MYVCVYTRKIKLLDYYNIYKTFLSALNNKRLPRPLDAGRPSGDS